MKDCLQDLLKAMAKSVYPELIKDPKESQHTEDSSSGHPNKALKVLEARIPKSKYLIRSAHLY